MSEHHHIAGPARAEPLAQGNVGARVRVPLTGTPSSDWSHLLCAHLTVALRGHAAVGHLRLSRIVQGGELVLEGVEPAEARPLGRELCAAVEAANKGMARAERPPAPCNMTAADAELIARELDAERVPAHA